MLLCSTYRRVKHGELLKGHNQHVGRHLNMHGTVYQDIYVCIPKYAHTKNQPGNSNRSWNKKSNYYEIKIEMQVEGMQENTDTKGEVKRK